MSVMDFKSIVAPSGSGTAVSAAQISQGPIIAPVARIKLYNADEWEAFTEEWAFYSLKKTYQDVVRFSGAGDKGVDVAGFTDGNGFNGVWDGFQCKHYDKPLTPGIAKPEIAKVIWYSFNGDYTPPRAYYFLGPQGIGTKLNTFLKKPESLRQEVKSTWDKDCRTKITDTQEVPLEGDFLAYFEKFDFSIFKAKQPLSMIDESRQHNPFHAGRFGGGLPPKPIPGAPPGTIGADESRYVEQLLSAYADHKKEPVPSPAALEKWTGLKNHFNRQREAFYHAETLRVFVRDKVEPGTFERLQDEIHAGVVDTCDGPHGDGYQRVCAVTKAVQDLQLTANPISPIAQVQDRHGICHQLANEDRLKWTE
ncbi:hypothetical protein LG047_00460 [Methylocystis sp. WRRC1]|uniref:ABC-three component system protein n=1 Tax=Methylocystis sp. WRRC1 TaxID=1732014 RepID=UPI001D158B41|nr:ABC-three component system protein [Methylocystis sp. WRRC1]MCC3243808.1 hypothetical protein [Methylocystis sp. WRRC1]